MSVRALSQLDHCMHDARDALAALSTAGEVLERATSTAAVRHEAGAVVARQAHELIECMGELMTHARQGSAQAGRALVVSDDMHLLARLAGLLSHAGYRIDLALSAVAGYEALAREQPDVVAVDLRTSAGEARSLARLARGAGFTAWLIAIEAAVAPRGAAPCGAHGFDVVLARAFDIKALRVAVGAERAGRQRTWRTAGFTV